MATFFQRWHLTPKLDPLVPVRRWLAALEIPSRSVAELICRWVPNTCSAGYSLRWQGRIWLHLPPLCKLNPLHEELLDLRFRAADFLYELEHPSVDAA